MRVLPATILTAALALILAGCTAGDTTNSADPAPAPAETGDSTACLAAWAQAEADTIEFDENGPFAAYINAGGDPLPEDPDQRAALEEIIDNDEAAWLAIIEPLYQECDGAAQFIDGARAHPSVAGRTDASFIDDGVLFGFCFNREDAPACEGWEDYEF